MKRVFLFSGWLLISQLVFAQKKSLPECSSIETQLSEIDNSFDNLMTKFKTTKKSSIFDQWNSDFSICGEKGTVQQIKGFPEFSFEFSGENYNGVKSEFDSLFVHVGKQVYAFYKATHDYSIIEEDDGKSIRFYEKGKGTTLSGKSIWVKVRYKDLLTGSELYSVLLVFEYIKPK